MKYKIPVLVSVVPGFLLFLVGCASTRQIAPVATGPIATNSVRVVVSRPAGNYGWADAFTISDNGAKIGDIGPKGQLAWDRSPGLMVITAMATLNPWLSEEARRGEPLRLGVGAGKQYEIRVYFPFFGTGSTPPKLELVSGTVVAVDDNGTNAPEGHIQQTPVQTGEMTTLVGKIRKIIPVIFHPLSGEEWITKFVLTLDNGDEVELWMNKRTVITDDTGKSSRGMTPPETGKRAEVIYTIIKRGSSVTTGGKEAASIRYVPSDYVRPASASTTATAAPMGTYDAKPVVQQTEEHSFTGTIIRKGLVNPLWYGRTVLAIFEAVDDTGRKVEFLLLNTSTITDANGKKSVLQRNKRAEIKYAPVASSYRKADGKNGVVTMRYLD